jgi:DNA-binding beta-propeller fold protein YncE
MDEDTPLLGRDGIDIGAAEYQNLTPPGPLQRFEGIAFSASGKILGVATADTDTVYLYRQKPGGCFEPGPYWTISGRDAGLNYPHDLSFSMVGNKELLAVAQRAGAISIFERNATDDGFGTKPAYEIYGKEAKLNFSDGVAFVPPDDELLAVCNVKNRAVSFYRKKPGLSADFDSRPAFELRHRSFSDPDGLAFSPCGQWLAVANHGNHTVSIFERRSRKFPFRGLRYGPKPKTIIKDPALRHPHSVAFTPQTNHLVVTNAGANYFSVYRPPTDAAGASWSHAPVLQKTIGPEEIFKKVNATNKAEGGPKGIAISQDKLAVCSPEHGIKIYTLKETGSNH